MKYSLYDVIVIRAAQVTSHWLISHSEDDQLTGAFSLNIGKIINFLS